MIKKKAHHILTESFVNFFVLVKLNDLHHRQVFLLLCQTKKSSPSFYVSRANTKDFVLITRFHNRLKKMFLILNKEICPLDVYLSSYHIQLFILCLFFLI